MQFHCIGDEDTVRGFRLAGVPGRAVADPAAAAAALAAACAQPDCRIVIVSSPVAASIRDEIETVRLGRDRPLIVEVPGPTESAVPKRSLTDLVQQAVGLRIETETVP